MSASWAVLAENTDPMISSNLRMTTISGTLAGRGVECIQFRMGSGEQISLSGAVPEGPIGEVINLEGQWARLSRCMQGREFRVIRVVE